MHEVLKTESLREWVISVHSAIREPNTTPDYSIAFESVEDLEDARSILYGLDADPKMLERYPSFDTWKINPLNGIERGRLAYLRAHARMMAPWFRSPRDLLMRLSLIMSRPDGKALMPIIWMGLANLAEHVALLASLGKESRCFFSMSLDSHCMGIRIGLADKRGRLIFSGSVSHSEARAGSQFSALMKAEKVYGEALLILPASVEGHQHEMVSPTPSIGRVEAICATTLLIYRLDFATKTATRLDRLPKETHGADILGLEAA